MDVRHPPYFEEDAIRRGRKSHEGALSQGAGKALPCCLSGRRQRVHGSFQALREAPHGFLLPRTAGETKRRGVAGCMMLLQWAEFLDSHRKTCRPAHLRQAYKKYWDITMRRRKAKLGMPPKCFNKTGHFRIRRKAGKGKPDAALGQPKQS